MICFIYYRTVKGKMPRALLPLVLLLLNLLENTHMHSIPRLKARSWSRKFEQKTARALIHFMLRYMFDFVCKVESQLESFSLVRPFSSSTVFMQDDNTLYIMCLLKASFHLKKVLVLVPMVFKNCLLFPCSK